MYALVTGASGGIGREIALLLAEKGYDLILCARSKEKLEEVRTIVSQMFGRESIVYPADLSLNGSAQKLFESVKHLDIGVVVNNAGFGKIGAFTDISLKDETDMLNINITALHILTKLFCGHLKRGHILNVASMAAYQPDPHMAAYGATKAYVLHLSRAVNYELKRQNKQIVVSTLCPGPVDTGFNQTAGGEFKIKAMTAKACAKIAVKGMFKGKSVIIPSFRMKVLRLLSKIAPTALILPAEYIVQTAKIKKEQAIEKSDVEKSNNNDINNSNNNINTINSPKN